MPTAKIRQGEYGLMGLADSGYTMKVLAALRYKNVPHYWLDRFANNRLYQRHANVQLIPMVFLPDGTALQDSTPIIELLETRFPEPAVHPQDPALRFLSDLLEEYGDEWANKLMFHYRWSYPADQQHRSRSLAQATVGGLIHPLIGRLARPLMSRVIVRRMVPRMAFAGSNDNNRPILVESFANLVDMLEVHLQSRNYLFGGRPAFGDFGLWGQLHQAYDDPSCHAIVDERAPMVAAWIERMYSPQANGEFESLTSLAPTLAPIFSREVGPRFLAWSAANASAWDAGEPQTELEMDGGRYYQKTFKYPAQGLATLREKFAAASDDASLVGFLTETGCLESLRA